MTRKKQQAFFRIAEAARITRETAHTIRSWDTKFPQIRPVKRGGGQRYYRQESIDLLHGISYLIRTAGFTVEGVQRIFRKHGERTVRQIGADKDLAPLMRTRADASQQSGLTTGLPVETRNLLRTAAAELREAARSLRA